MLAIINMTDNTSWYN